MLIHSEKVCEGESFNRINCYIIIHKWYSSTLYFIFVMAKADPEGLYNTCRGAISKTFLLMTFKAEGT